MVMTQIKKSDSSTPYCQAVVMAHKDVLGMASWVFMMVLPSINYVIFPLAQTLASPDLRQKSFF